ncbi:MAG: hypothetical protein H0V26_14565, partial [Solirubrobacterales bacterium]|nr:hypothetical protein [Solirubrobacterales bacterium]
MNFDLFRAGLPVEPVHVGEPALVAIYADESCLGNGRDGDNPGGAGGLVEMADPGTGHLQRWDYWVAERATT